MASYADVAASGPPQPASQKAANLVDEVIPTEPTNVEPLVDVDPSADTGHLRTVPHDYLSQEVKTTTQADRLEREAEEEEAEAAEARETPVGAPKKATAADKAKAKGKQAKAFVHQHRLLLGNGLLTLTVAAVVGYLGVAKYRAGQLNWKVAGVGAAGVAAFAFADAFVARLIRERKK